MSTSIEEFCRTATDDELVDTFYEIRFEAPEAHVKLVFDELIKREVEF